MEGDVIEVKGILFLLCIYLYYEVLLSRLIQPSNLLPRFMK